MVEGMVIGGHQSVFYLLSSDERDLAVGDGEVRDDLILGVYDQLFAFFELGLHHGALFDGGGRLGVGGVHVVASEGFEEAVEVAAQNEVVFGAQTLEFGQSLHEVVNLCFVLLLFGAEVRPQQEDVVDHEEGTSAGPVEKLPLFFVQIAQNSFSGDALLERSLLSQDKRILTWIMVDIVLLGLLSVLEERWPILLKKQYVSIHLFQAVYKFLQLTLLVEEAELEEPPHLFQVGPSWFVYSFVNLVHTCKIAEQRMIGDCIVQFAVRTAFV